MHNAVVRLQVYPEDYPRYTINLRSVEPQSHFDSETGTVISNIIRDLNDEWDTEHDQFLVWLYQSEPPNPCHVKLEAMNQEEYAAHFRDEIYAVFLCDDLEEYVLTSGQPTDDIWIIFTPLE